MSLNDETAAYQQICSARTVQSDRQGFFNEFYMEVKDSCGEKWLQNYFGKLKSNEARILSIFSDREICDPVLGVLENVQPVYKQKDGLFSAQRRAQADKHHLLGELQQALAHANLAVVRAPAKGVDPVIDDGLTLAMAFRTRSIILIGLGDGETALSDLKLAASFGLESKQSVDYYIKMAKAYACMGETARAEISLKIAEKLSGGGNALIDSCRKELPLVKRSTKKQRVQVPNLTHGENQNLRGASNLVKLVETKEKGRFVVANDSVQTGDVVLCEQPVAACLLPNFYGSHCHHCFERLVTPVPCLNCSGIAFCSAQCMGEACETYHRFECEYMDLFIGSGMSILCFIALRIFTQAQNLESGLNTANLLYANLCTHEDSRQADDLLQRSLMAGFLLRCLQKSQYFGRRKTEGVNPTAIELQVGAALLGLLQVLQYNAHEIYETLITDEHRFDGSKVVYVGAGLYGTGAYFNHECWPTVARYFVGKKLVLAAIKPHRPNEIVAENYGPTFANVNLKERQRSLRGRYLFSCNCMACQENWPTLQKLDKQVRFWCTTTNCQNVLKFPKDLSKDVRCARCRKNVSLKESVAQIIKIEELYREAAEAMKDQKTQEAIALFKEGIDMFYQIAVMPHKDTLIAQQSLRKCMADTGTTFKK
ncbi:SET and MYND domain-containing protein 4-like [Teleopsis dalmanni]|uniref:SET and MYND domain-containing protein 4-like n=1 Tax=Teleopsis dalmanni TaxID=139649 RepID=UPI0018CE79C0|nr:SET and MYND domain-containing protein 4-like [Teleopsis dalmanni]